jgi:outer membrane protein OmpA-like peptidoglycan-associated protein
MFPIAFCAAVAFSGQVVAELTSEGCADNPFFTRMPNYHPYECDAVDFDAKQFPIGAVSGDEGTTVHETVEGAYSLVTYEVNEGAKASSPLQILRNHLNAARAAGATVVKDFGALSHMRGEWPNIQQQIATLRLAKDGHEYWIHLGSVNDGDYYSIAMVRREQMKQDVSANAMFEELNRVGHLTIEVLFDTAKPTLRPESNAVLDQAAEMLKAAPGLKVEVAGHTDNAGTPAANDKLSQQRAEGVRAALVGRGVAADRMTAKGYGQSSPVADNRSEEGRAKNRRVELVRK